MQRRIRRAPSKGSKLNSTDISVSCKWVPVEMPCAAQPAHCRGATTSQTYSCNTSQLIIKYMRWTSSEASAGFDKCSVLQDYVVRERSKELLRFLLLDSEQKRFS